jgi:hypothetical protein
VVALVAAVAIPFATGAPSKYYTLMADPTSTCTTPQRQTFTLTLTNQTRNQNLGSANITAPSYAALVSATLSGTTGTATVNQPDGFGSTPNTIRLRNLVLPTIGSPATITVVADVTAGSGGKWTSIVKQSNNFSDSGPGNLFSLKPGTADPALTVAECASEYVFVDQPDDAERGAAQTVTVELQVNGTAVPVSGPLTLVALQDGAEIDDQDDFSGLTVQASGNQWTFTVTGNVSGTDYALQAGETVSETFTIADGLCQPNVTDPEHLNSSCSLTSTLNGGAFESGVTINDHKLEPIAINFEAGDVADGKCDPWQRASYTDNGQTYHFPGVALDFGWGGGVLRVIYRVRNAEWVLTQASRGNSDIEICAGARHGVNTHLNGPSGDPFTGKYGDAVWDSGDGLFWGVLGSVSNPGKVKNDPVVCGSGNQNLPTGPGGSSETWRAWTICIPYDWDWKNFG